MMRIWKETFVYFNASFSHSIAETTGGGQRHTFGLVATALTYEDSAPVATEAQCKEILYYN
jgi:hypothetical protein